MTNVPLEPRWVAIEPPRARSLSDARIQLHYAAQLASAVGVSYLPALSDDSHANLGWDPSHQALVSHGVRSRSRTIRAGIRPADLSLIVLDQASTVAAIPLSGSTIRKAADVLRDVLASAGLDREHTLEFDGLPQHPVGNGAAFDGSDTVAFAELAHWFANAHIALDALREHTHGSDVRCWPHHFDIATLATVGPGQSCGAGLTPGDEWYQEPYFYVNAYPSPPADRVVGTLDGGGTWHTTGWTGAVLPGSRLRDVATEQAAQVQSFLDSAFAACSRLVAAVPA